MGMRYGSLGEECRTSQPCVVMRPALTANTPGDTGRRAGAPSHKPQPPDSTSYWCLVSAGPASDTAAALSEVASMQ